ncbi:Rap1a/Tai family immunity protein [Psychrosphaera aquimarina]|uniref:Rap1a/Tai family immunity protein n=1 Tax=Psychrosphaera aquimarina TaxID=2044854 RepID=A0ABU3QYI3_9GAMM|nr:Rap1a/Tai family immunity protein [Psychrosphaera aquimarina]MDU0112477.1 Rap1a/Tai family immunity protein [Psychrosphaera aquimarina]
MKIKTVKQLFVVVGLSLTSFVATADFKSEIIESCTEYQKNDGGKFVNACKLYIDGFIDASMQYHENTNDDKSSFIKRVYRTRTMSGEIVNSDFERPFCIPKKLQRQQVASNVAKSIELNNLDIIDFRLVVHQSLVNQYPC